MNKIKFFILLLLPALAFSQTKVEKITVVENKAEISVPKELTKMSSEAWSLKYPGRSQPTLTLTDENIEVNLIGDYTQQPAKPSQLEAYTDFQIEAFKKRHSEMTVLEKGIKTINSKKVGFFKFTSEAIDQKIFNYYFFAVLDNRILLFTFNCIDKLRSSWEKKADEIFASLVIK